jgi:hypothetical protein
MKNLLKKRGENEERQEIKGEKLYGSRNLFRQQKIKSKRCFIKW